MNLNFNADSDEKCDEGRLPLTEVKKPSILYLPEAGNAVPGRRLRGDRNQCRTCYEYFNSFKAFDQHRTGLFNGVRNCLTVVEMQTMNFGKTKDDFWLCPVAPKDRERISLIRNKSNKRNIHRNHSSSK